MNTTHSLPPPAPQMYEESLQVQRNRRLLIVVVVLCLAAAAYLTYWVQCGDLVKPHRHQAVGARQLGNRNRHASAV